MNEEIALLPRRGFGRYCTHVRTFEVADCSAYCVTLRVPLANVRNYLMKSSQLRLETEG
jgi:hypothetical protein